MFKISGSHELQMGKNFSQYYTFTPKTLFNSNCIDIDTEVTSLLSQAHRLLGILEGISQYAPNIDTCTEMIIKKEALLSCQIDGINAPFSDIFGMGDNQNATARQALNCTSAMKYACNKPISNKLICEIHDILMNGSDNDAIGSFRTTQIFLHPCFIGNMKVYNPTAPEDMMPVLDDLEKFISADNQYDVLIKSALIHYQFETIHPFNGGNGRIGRILAMSVLLQHKMLSKPIIALSHYLFYNKVEYFDRISSVQNFGDYTQWVKCFIKAIIVATDNSIRMIERCISLRDNNVQKIMTLRKASKNTMLVYEYIEKNPIIGVRDVSDELDLSFNTVAKAVGALVAIGILKQTNGQSRHRCFVFENLVKIFEFV